MILPATFLSFVATCAVIESTPGPNMGYLAILSVNEGRQAGFSAVAGIALGLLIVGGAAAAGLTALLSNSPLAYDALRWGGVFYMLWLARDCWRGPPPEKPGREHRGVKFFERGLVVNLLNPKAAVFFVAILPDFIDPSLPVRAQTITLTAAYVSIATAIHLLVVALAGTAGPYLADPARNRVARRVLSIALAGIALWFAWTTGRISLNK